MEPASVRVAKLATAQHGVVSRSQLRLCGLADATIAAWLDDRRVHRIHRGVYAVGHQALSTPGRLTAALLYAGPGAALSHLTAAWWWSLLDVEPRTIEVTTAAKRRPTSGVRAHRTRHLLHVIHQDMPVTDPGRTLLDIASMVRVGRLRRMLADAEYRGLVDLASLQRSHRGHRGAANLRRALAAHLPQLARTLSPLEDEFLLLCERAAVPRPEVNVRIAGLTVDCLWREARLIVELDGRAAHGSHSAMERDRRRDLRLRAEGYAVLRYTWAQVTRQSDAVLRDLRAALAIPPSN
jgi:hypothetical protein